MRQFVGALALAVSVACAPGGARAEDNARALSDEHALQSPSMPERRGTDYRLIRLDGKLLKWGAPQLGTGATIRYAFVRKDMTFDGTPNCGGMRSLHSIQKAAAISDADLRRETAAAFALWQDAANVSFRPVDDPSAADILIGAQIRPLGRAFTGILYDRDDRADGDVRRLRTALICFNPEKGWKIGFGGDVEVYDFRYTLAHEIGHAIGLDHPGPSGQMMGFAYEESFRQPQAGDVAGAIALYGRRGAPIIARPAPTMPEPDGSPAPPAKAMGLQ